MSIPTNKIVQLMLLVDWTTIETALRRVDACPNLDHEIELFRYVHTKPGTFIRKTQTLPLGSAVDDELYKLDTLNFFSAIFRSYTGAQCMPQRIDDEMCKLSLFIPAQD